MIMKWQYKNFDNMKMIMKWKYEKFPLTEYEKQKQGENFGEH